MSKQSPYGNISIGEDGLSVRCELDVHYLTDDQLETVREHVETLQTENAKLRELVQSFHSAMLCTLDTGMWPTDPEWLESCMRELGVPGTEVDA